MEVLVPIPMVGFHERGNDGFESTVTTLDWIGLGMVRRGSDSRVSIFYHGSR